MAVMAAVSAVFVYRRDGALLPPGTVKILALALPLLILTSAMSASQWDEFSHWLWSSRFLLETDGFPDKANAVTGASYPAYPYGWPLLTYLASRLAGQFVENAGALFNVLLLLSFALVIVRIINLGLEKGPNATLRWEHCALAGLAVTLSLPQKVMLTAYADAGSAVMTGLGGVLGWMALNALAEKNVAEKDHGRAFRLAALAGASLTVLVDLKQATLVLFVLVVASVVLAGLRDPAIRLGELAKLLPAMILPPIALYLLWRYHVATELSGREFALRPFAEWNIHLVPQIIWKMIAVLAKKGAFLLMMLAAVGFGARALIRMHTPFDRLAVIVAAVFLGYNAFLLLTYVAAFGENDALRVASLWRYNMHIGLLGVAFAAFGLSVLWKKKVEGRLKPKGALRGAAWIPIVLMVAAPFIFAKKIRFDLEPDKPHFRAVGAQAARLIPDGARYFILDPGGSGESAMIARYEVGLSSQMTGYMGAFHRITRRDLEDVLERQRPSFILVHSSTPDVVRVLGREFQPKVSYLLQREGAGWMQVGAWPYPAGD